MPPLYRKCPKCGYERQPADSASDEACPACGLLFAKYLKSTVGGSPARAAAAAEAAQESGIKALLLYVPEAVQPVHVHARAALLAVLVLYGAKLAAMNIPSWEISSSLMHPPLLVIHEFGHVLFRPFGEFMTLLGGSLTQVAMPLVFGGIFLVKNRDPYSAAVMLWWSAVSLMDVAPYIYDAYKPQHILLSGRTGEDGAHDFIDVLGDLGLLSHAQPIGRATHAFALLMMVTALAWGAYIVRMQLRNRKNR
jgi:hypothetical protein